MDKREKQIFLFGILIIVISVILADLISKEFFVATYLVGVLFTLICIFFAKKIVWIEIHSAKSYQELD